MSSYRPERVAEQIHKEISRLLLDGIKDPRVACVTLTEVKLTRDLRLARVYFTVNGDDESDRLQAESGLKSASAFIRRQLGDAISMRYIPELRFQYDPSVSYGRKIEDLLRQVKDDLQDDSADQGTDQDQ